ncbi:DUF192 domain-containing protein [Thioalkalivibrio sp.]|uniref:DUF192 domain-containing protein n=1 Tax=Thioalkalivibrio sp. TaxID=2093813 RepID=UPI003566C593
MPRSLAGIPRCRPRRRGGPGTGLTPAPALALAVLLWLLAAVAAAEGLPVRELAIADRILTVEIAATPEAMSRGLMFREHLPDGHGMLFVWPGDQVVGMWMQNTLIPLSVAFIDSDYRIRNIAHMEPHSRDVHASDGPVRYALEVNRGWFQRHGVAPGMRIAGLGTLLDQPDARID